MSGGRSPWRMLSGLAEEDLPWFGIDLYQVDERVAPLGHQDRNLTHLLACFPAGGPTIHPLPVEDDDLERAADAYARTLPDRLDLVHLGLGADGHTASLVPGDPVLDVSDRAVAPTGAYQGRRRLTLTYPTLNGAREVLWLVTGADKADALRRLLAGDQSIPAGRVVPPRDVVVADSEAAR